MSEYQRIIELNSKISNLLEAVGKNHGQFTGIDKDLAANYIRELYELVLAIKPSAIQSVRPVVEITAATDSIPVEEKQEPPKVAREIIQPVTATAKEPPSQSIEPVQINTNGSTETKKVKKLIGEINKALVESDSKKSISELYAEKKETDKSTLNEKYKNQGKEIADKLKHTPIKDLKAYIGLNKRFTFINSLFNGNEQQYDEAVTKVNSFVNYEEALTYIQEQVMSENEWREEEPLVSEFFTLVMRRYLN